MSKNKLILGIGVTGMSCADFFKSKDILFKIFDTRGTVVMTTEIVETISVKDLAVGTYYAKISQGDKVITKTFIKQ
jgi:UDP-N-acetylmuramoylalanine-D-glutamate ligase